MFKPSDDVRRRVRRINESISIANDASRSAREFARELLRPHKGVVMYVLDPDGEPITNHVNAWDGSQLIAERSGTAAFVIYEFIDANPNAPVLVQHIAKEPSVVSQAYVHIDNHLDTMFRDMSQAEQP